MKYTMDMFPTMKSIKAECQYVIEGYILIWSVFCLILLVFPSYFSALYCLTSTIISWMRKVGWGMITSECQWSSEVTINNGVLWRRGKLCEKRRLWKTRMKKKFHRVFKILYYIIYWNICRLKGFTRFRHTSSLRTCFLSI